jgi:hypothetical protein
MSNSDAALLVFAIPGALIAIWAIFEVRSLHRLERQIADQGVKAHPAE